MRSIYKHIALTPVSLLIASPALAATVIDFSASPATFTSYSSGGATITSLSGGPILTTTTPNGTLGILADDSPRAEFRVDFSTNSSFVSVDLGDFNADADLAFLEAFDASNLSLGFASLDLDASDSAMHTLSIIAPNISYAIFGGRPPSLNGSSLLADNVTFDSALGAVPEPSTWVMMLLGFGAIGGAVGFRRRKTIVSYASS